MKSSISVEKCHRVAMAIVWFVSIGIGSFATVVDAKDLYLSTTGNDSVSYAANNQSNPWRTLDYSIANMQGGDTLYMRSGTYVATAKLTPTISGTSNSPTRITSFTGEAVTIDLSNIPKEWLSLDGVDYWEISELEFINTHLVLELSLTFPSQFTVFRNNRVVASRGGDNSSAVRILPNAQNTLVDGNEIVGPGRKADGINHNTSCIYQDRASNFSIVNNRLSNCVVGIHYKHAATGSGGANIEYAYNYITDVDEAIRYNGNNGFIHDNIFGPDSGVGTVGMENGSPGGDNNLFEHNTFVGGNLTLSDAGGGVQNNVVRNNIFVDSSARSEIDICRWSACNHNTALDYNLHPTAEAVAEQQVRRTLSQWQSYYGGSTSSITGTPVFQGGSNFVTVDDFRLAPSSPGVGVASDGTDMGARIDLFGTTGLLLSRPNPPQTLTVN